MTEQPQIIQSEHTQTFQADGQTVEIDIYRTEDSQWILEIVDEGNNSTLWENEFDDDKDALAEALSALKEEGIDCFVAPNDA